MKCATLTLAVFMAVLTACAGPRGARITDTMALKQPAPDQTAAEPAVPGAAADGEFAGLDTKMKYSLLVKNAELRDTLLLLSRKTGVTIVADRDVSGRVTADFKDKSIKDILFVLLKPYGYTAYVENDIIRVSRPRLVSKTFYLSYLKDKRQSTSTMNAAISESNVGGYSSAGSNINLNVSSGTPGSSSGSSSSSSAPSGNVSIKTTGTSDFWNEIIHGLEVIIFGDSTNKSVEGGYSKGEKSGKQLVVNELAGIVYVRDYSDNMEHIKSFIDDIEHSVKRQVMIQAHIAEVSLSDSFAYGVDWSYLLNNTIGSDVRPMKFTQRLTPTPPSEIFQINITNNKVSALLDAMKEQGQLNVLSSPKISTLNNQKAVIKLTTKEVSWIQNTIIPTQGSQVVYTIPQVDEVGIFLDVTPQINEKGTVTMQIHPSISEKSKTSLSPDGKSSKPIIDVREVDSMIEVKNNQTVVIAGLIVDKIIETKRSVPLLGDIPYLGALFSFVSQEKKKTELVILITPFILNDKTIAEIRADHEERLSKAGRKFSITP